jgi:antitoxin component of RelBE/YafQ-DinJ toxin-antitoxin module
MEDKAARFTILIDADRKKAFDDLCASQDVTVSQVIRQLINQYIAQHDEHDAKVASRSGKSVRK